MNCQPKQCAAPHFNQSRFCARLQALHYTCHIAPRPKLARPVTQYTVMHGVRMCSRSHKCILHTPCWLSLLLLEAGSTLPALEAPKRPPGEGSSPKMVCTALVRWSGLLVLTEKIGTAKPLAAVRNQPPALILPRKASTASQPCMVTNKTRQDLQHVTNQHCSKQIYIHPKQHRFMHCSSRFLSNTFSSVPT